MGMNAGVERGGRLDAGPPGTKLQRSTMGFSMEFHGMCSYMQ